MTAAAASVRPNIVIDDIILRDIIHITKGVKIRAKYSSKLSKYQAQLIMSSSYYQDTK